ncbi:hypothetical protein DFH29DRAFT_874073 [Suillus ampliporus]|nr:hypothetical protein DFH29DRAFT_874073 [Suillus ampliporus]
MDAYVGLIASQKLQTESYILSYLLKDRVYSGDLWELVMERSIESLLEETLHSHQCICNVNGDGGRHAAVERFLVEERRKQSHIGAPAKHEIKTPLVTLRHYFTPHWRAPPPLENSSSLEASPPLSLGQPPSVQEKPAYGTLNRIGPSLPLLSTWITADVQEAFYDAFQTELDMQSELMTKTPATQRSNANLRNHGLDLLILQAKMHRAQTEIMLYTLSLENTHAFDFSDHSSQTSWDQPILRPILSDNLRYCDVDTDDDTDQSHNDFEIW